MKADDSPRTRPARRNISDVGRLLHPVNVRSGVLAGIFILLCLYALKSASAFLVPVVLACLLNALFAPAVRGLNVLWIPRPLGAAILLVAILGTVTYGGYRLSGPAAAWLAKVPESLELIELRLRGVKKSVAEVSKTSEQVDRITSLGVEEKTQKVEVKKPGLGQFVLGQTQEFLIGAGVTFGLLYFLLASGDLFLRKLVAALPRLEEKKLAVEIFHRIEHHISRYLFTITLINSIFGTAVGAGLFMIGIPNPVLFGVMAALLNFIPYVGAVVGITTVTLAAALMTEETSKILLAPALYWGLNLLEEYVLRPIVMGRRFTLNPVVIFVWVIFWGWMWGIVGALMAVPLLAIFKIICEHVESLAPIGEFLSNEGAKA
ncbi:MAG TPA: AI-2E family transporter [Candidatus Acidoferrales bacterium]|nr:AI-2E family transporter [Candidatus Acidoferrales bacterium]